MQKKTILRLMAIPCSQRRCTAAHADLLRRGFSSVIKLSSNNEDSRALRRHCSPSVIPSSDSTPREVSGIDSRHMQRAALYARVSTDAQQKEATIESQLDDASRKSTEQRNG